MGRGSIVQSPPGPGFEAEVQCCFSGFPRERVCYERPLNCFCSVSLTPRFPRSASTQYRQAISKTAKAADFKSVAYTIVGRNGRQTNRVDDVKLKQQINMGTMLKEWTDRGRWDKWERESGRLGRDTWMKGEREGER